MKNLIFASLFLLILAAQSCRKDILYPQPIVSITSHVSFDTTIVPILVANCATAGCHRTGIQTPDLTAANAWSSLTGLGYVPTDDTSEASAKKCILYTKLTATTKPMPPKGKLTASDIAKIFAWIKQGSQNN